MKKLFVVVLGLLLAGPALAQTAIPRPRLPAITGNPIKDIQTDIQGAQTSENKLLTQVGTDVANFLTNLAAIPDAIALSTSIPGLQDPVGNACWQQFGPLGELIKSHPLVISGKAAADLEALRLAAIGLNQICANPNCGQMFIDATNAAAAIAPMANGISLQSICAKIPVIGTSAVPTAVTPTAGVGTVSAPAVVPVVVAPVVPAKP